jgi:hypothetical protein
MTKEERSIAVRCLDEIDRALPMRPEAIVARSMSKALRELLTKSHGAADHAAPAAKPRRTRSAPAPVGGPA